MKFKPATLPRGLLIGGNAPAPATAPACRGNTDPNECSHLLLTYECNEAYFNKTVSDMCPGHCQACGSQLCNRDPDDCAATKSIDCGQILHGIDFDLECPILCGTCVAVVEANASDRKNLKALLWVALQ